MKSLCTDTKPNFAWRAKKTWLPIHPRNFGSHVTGVTLPSVALQENQCEMFHFLASVRSYNLILHIHVCGQLTAVADQYHMTGSRAQVSTHRGYVLFWSLPLTSFQFPTDRWLNSNWICLLQCFFIKGSFALNLG